MGSIRLLDCTLGDGGKVNDWRFGAAEISSIMRGLERAKIDLIEAGVLQERKCGTSRSIYDSTEAVLNSWGVSKKVANVLMIDLQDTPEFSTLPKCDPNFRHILRVVFGKTKLEESLSFCKDAIDKGYTLIIHPVHTMQYSAEEFRTLVSKVSVLKPYAFYLDNQSGAMSTEETKIYFNIANSLFDDKVAMGYRAPNDGIHMCGFIQLVSASSNMRDIILDTSLCSIGKCGGKPATEAMSQFLNEHYCKSYDLSVLRELAEKYIAPIYPSAPWGYLLQHSVASQLKFAPEYVDYYTQRFQATVKELEDISEWIAPEKRWNFSEDNAKIYWKSYYQSKMNMAVIVPTCNRAQAVQHILFSSAAAFERYGIDVIIYDSSSDDKTEAVVMNYQLDGYENVKYVRYNGMFDGFSLDHKVIAAYAEFRDQYEYLWLCRDGLIITIRECYRVLQKLAEQKYDYIVVDASFRRNNQKYLKIYNSNQDFFKEQAVSMTVLGSLVLSNNTACELIEQYPLDHSNYALWLMIVPFYYCLRRPLKIAGYIGNVFTYNPSAASDSFWNNAGKAMQQWAYYWFHLIQGLPQEYEPYKKEVLKIEMFDFHPFYLSSLLRMRRNGGLTIGLIRKYKKYLPHVSDTPMWKFYISALVPRWVANLMVESIYTKPMRLLIAIYQLFLPHNIDEQEEKR